MSCRSSPTNSTSTSPSTTCRRHQQVEQDRAPPLLVHQPNWRAQPLVSYRVIVDLISATTTKTGLTVRCEIDETLYHKGITVSDAEMATINITRHNFHGEWNYTIAPNSD